MIILLGLKDFQILPLHFMSDDYKYIVFDFDGVVCDSTNECMVTAWNAWERYNNREGFRTSIKDFTNVEIKKFKPLRPYVRGAGEYYILMRSLSSKNKTIKTQDEFDYLREKWKKHLSGYKNLFFVERDRLRKDDIVTWIKLHYIYHDVIEVMKTLNIEKRLLVATMKDGESVNLILNYYGVSLKPENMVDQSQISTKLNALKFFVKERKINKRDICFIDDNITHLISPHESGYKVFMTTWGPTIDEHLDIAKKNNISFLKDCNLLLRKS